MQVRIFIWKFVKTRLRIRFWDNFGLFCSTVDDIVDSTMGKNREEIETLIGEKVQLFDDAGRKLRKVTANTYKLVEEPDEEPYELLKAV